MRTGTPIEQLTLADATKLASRRSRTKITTGSAYPRFHGQDEFRLAVLEAFLFNGPDYSDVALNAIVQAIQEFEDGKSEPLGPEDVPTLIEKVAAEHENVMGADSELALRLYAIWRLQAEGSDYTKRQLAKVRARDEEVNREWARIVATIAKDLGAAPLKGLDYRDIEFGLTAIRTGLLARKETTGIPDGILERLTVCLFLGFFEEVSMARKTTLPQRLATFLRSVSPRKRQPEISQKVVTESAESLRRLSPITDEDINEEDSPALQRAMKALRDAGKGL
ncbi:MAG TPA: hypothetical protein VK488_04105 [Gaiellaceae bacterium]|nr:hypothetical protein [Gaiellaceae bacterium]